MGCKSINWKFQNKLVLTKRIRLVYKFCCCMDKKTVWINGSTRYPVKVSLPSKQNGLHPISRVNSDLLLVSFDCCESSVMENSIHANAMDKNMFWHELYIADMKCWNDQKHKIIPTLEPWALTLGSSPTIQLWKPKMNPTIIKLLETYPPETTCFKEKKWA